MKKGLFAAVFLLIASMAMADNLNLTSLPGFTYGGYYVGPATGNLNGGVSFAWVCNDYTDTTYIPSSFGVNVSTIPSLTYAMYASHPPTAGQVATYEQAAILLWQMSQPGNQNSDAIGGLNFAIWNLFNPAVPDPGSSATWVTWAQSQDLSAWNYVDVRIFTDTNTVDPHNQEGMSGSATPVPEPGTSILFGAGVGLIACGAIRRRQKKE